MRVSLTAAPTSPDDISAQSAFETLLSPLMVPAYRLAYGMLGDRDEAEDAVHGGKTWLTSRATLNRSRTARASRVHFPAPPSPWDSPVPLPAA